MTDVANHFTFKLATFGAHALSAWSIEFLLLGCQNLSYDRSPAEEHYRHEDSYSY